MPTNIDNAVSTANMASSRDPPVPASASHRLPVTPSWKSDEMQQKTRRRQNFSETERSLQRTQSSSSSSVMSNFLTLRPVQPKRLVSDPVANILSYLGANNPWPQPVVKEDEVWMLDNVAYPPKKEGKNGEQWEAEFITAVFSQHPSCKVGDTVAEIADLVGIVNDEEAKKTIEKRLIPFLMDIQPGKQVFALHGGSTQLKFAPGGRNGISSDVKALPSAQGGMIVPTTAQVPKQTTGLLQMKTFFAESEGWGVISDVDDTIKVTQTSDPIGILRSTFISEPEPVTGMPDLYRWLQNEITSVSPFFYLSASPYNLYPFLREFRDAYYPHGMLVLRDASWMTIPGLLSNLTLGTEEYKVGRMEKIHAWLPSKRMILIGDSTQSDPEAYGDMYRKHPGWARVILIRKVMDIAAVGIEDKNKPERFEKAFEGVPKDVWHVFEDPAECYKIIQDAVSAS